MSTSHRKFRTIYKNKTSYLEVITITPDGHRKFPVRRQLPEVLCRAEDNKNGTAHNECGAVIF